MRLTRLCQPETAAEAIKGKSPLVPFGHTESPMRAARESGERQGQLL